MSPSLRRAQRGDGKQGVRLEELKEDIPTHSDHYLQQHKAIRWMSINGQAKLQIRQKHCLQDEARPTSAQAQVWRGLRLRLRLCQLV